MLDVVLFEDEWCRDGVKLCHEGFPMMPGNPEPEGALMAHQLHAVAPL